MTDPDTLALDLAVGCDRFMRFFRRQHPSDTTATWRALSLLARSGPLRLGAIAEAVQLSQPGATDKMNRLTAAGLVARQHDPSDGRAVLYALTAAGRAHLDQLRARPVAAVRRGLDVLSAAERAQLAAALPLLERVVAVGDPVPASSTPSKGTHESA